MTTNLAGNYEDARKSHERVKEHNQKRIGELEAKIKNRIEANKPYEYLEKELAQVRSTAEAGEKLSLANLEKCKAEADQEQADNKARHDAAQAETSTKRKEAARAVWVSNGGESTRFDAVWEAGLSDDLLKKSVLENKEVETPVFRSL